MLFVVIDGDGAKGNDSTFNILVPVFFLHVFKLLTTENIKEMSSMNKTP